MYIHITKKNKYIYLFTFKSLFYSFCLGLKIKEWMEDDDEDTTAAKRQQPAKHQQPQQQTEIFTKVAAENSTSSGSNTNTN